MAIPGSNTEEQALIGIRILVTRAVGQAGKLTSKLQAHGAFVEELPLIEIKDPTDFGPLDKCLKSLPKYDWMIFASANAVRHTMARAEALGVPIKEMLSQHSVAIAVVGAATARVAAGYDLKVAFAPEHFVSDSLVEQFPDFARLEGKNIFWPRTDIGREIIVEKLSEAGATVDCAIAYLTVTPQFSPEQAQKLVRQLEANYFDAITLTSSQAVKNLAAILKKGLPESFENGFALDDNASAQLKALLLPVKLAAIGPVTAEAAKKYLGKIDIEATDHTMAGLTEALLASLKFRQKRT